MLMPSNFPHIFPVAHISQAGFHSSQGQLYIATVADTEICRALQDEEMHVRMKKRMPLPTFKFEILSERKSFQYDRITCVRHHRD